MRRLFALLFPVVLMAGASCAHAQRPAPRVPTLVVFFTIDQLRPEYLDLYASQLTGGLARFRNGGAFFTNAFQDHAITETAPGHASTLSGRFPRSTGIIANHAGVGDPKAYLIGATGEGATPFRFRGTTLFDWMRSANPASRALSVSRKDRGAILPLGTAKGEAYWYATNGTFTTSSYYGDTLPTWVQAFNARRLPQSYAGKTWDLLLPLASYPEPDTVAAESFGEDYVFPHPFPLQADYAAAAFAAYPMMDDVTLQFALRGVAVRELGADPTRTDLLAVSLSTTDAVGHRFGPDSRELHDQIVRLDRYMGAFIDSLYKLRDSTNIVFALTADHGVNAIADVSVKSRYRTGKGGTADISAPIRALYQGMAAARVDTTAYEWDDGFLVLDPEKLARARINRDSVARSFAAAVRKVPGVLRADVFADLAKRDTVNDTIARRWLHMFPPDLQVAVTVTLKPFWYRGPVVGLVASHGTPHDYDARVPVIFYGPMVKAGRYDTFARVVDIAPTLASIIDTRPLERLDGRVLTEALR